MDKFCELFTKDYDTENWDAIVRHLRILMSKSDLQQRVKGQIPTNLELEGESCATFTYGVERLIALIEIK